MTLFRSHPQPAFTHTKLGSFGNNCVAVYFSPRLVCRFDLAFSANSTSWRIASEREGWSGCCFAQLSISDLSAGESRIADTGSCPVAGRPRFFRTTGIDFLAIIVLRKSEPVRSANFSPALTQATEAPMAQADSVPTPNHALNPDALAQQSTTPRRIRIKPADRRYFVGGSDARIIMGDDEAALLRLWREKRGEIEPEDLSRNLIVQLGVATEELNRSRPSSCCPGHFPKNLRPRNACRSSNIICGSLRPGVPSFR